MILTFTTAGGVTGIRPLVEIQVQWESQVLGDQI